MFSVLNSISNSCCCNESNIIPKVHIKLYKLHSFFQNLFVNYRVSSDHIMNADGCRSRGTPLWSFQGNPRGNNDRSAKMMKNIATSIEIRMKQDWHMKTKQLHVVVDLRPFFCHNICISPFLWLAYCSKYGFDIISTNPGAIITWPNNGIAQSHGVIPLTCSSMTQHCRDWARIQTSFWNHNRHPIPRPYGRVLWCLLWGFLFKKIDRVILASHFKTMVSRFSIKFYFKCPLCSECR